MSNESASEPFNRSFPIRFTHTDPAGFVFFPRYFEMFQAVSEDWFSGPLGVRFADMVMLSRVGQPTAYIECQFIKPCILGERLTLTIYLERFGTSSLDVRFVGSIDGELRLVARSVQVLLSMKSGRPVPFDDTMRKRMAAYMEKFPAPDAPMPSRRK
ncbi:MAG TPA: thioesterase family protein [Hyphomicrobiales bacterium]|nr:acyl-CoA thioesterase [Rhodobiaceae bacterium]HXK53574.1 thioesterase family protein [Hyphomicrobiales bacterium]